MSGHKTRTSAVVLVTLAVVLVTAAELVAPHAANARGIGERGLVIKKSPPEGRGRIILQRAGKTKKAVGDPNQHGIGDPGLKAIGDPDIKAIGDPNTRWTKGPPSPGPR